MDAKLAEVYGTVATNESDVETLAAARMAEKLASADALDVSGMSDEEAEDLASQLLGDDSAAADESTEENTEEEQTEEASENTEEEKTAGEEELTPAQEKIAEADHLGRVMAHAYVQERKEIEKQAGRLDGLKGAAAITAGQAAAKAGKAKAGLKSGAGKVMDHMSKHKKKYIAGAASTAVAGGAAAVAAKKMKKEASAEETEEISALDRLALARASEILKENGIEPAEQEKQSSIDEDKAAQLAEKVQARAQEFLVEAGYSFEE